jgi:hypothetical protein
MYRFSFIMLTVLVASSVVLAAGDGSTARDTASAKVCLVTVENGFGLPVAYASGFMLGETGLVVTDLATVAQPGVKQVRVRFKDNRRAVATEFRAADSASGVVILKLEEGLSNSSGLTLSTASSVAGTEVVAVGWKWAQEIDSGTGKVSNGVLASTIASRLSLGTPPGPVTFLKFETDDRPDIASGSPVLDPSGGVIGVLIQVAGTDRAIITPAGAVRNLLLAADADPKPLSALPKPYWPVAVEWLPGKPPTAADFAQMMMSIRKHSLCPKCNGTGTITVEKTVAVKGAGGVIKPSTVTEVVTCPECKGERLIFPEDLYSSFEKVAESGTYLTMAADVDSKSKDAVVSNVSELLKSVAIVGATYRDELTHRAVADMSKGGAYPRGLMALARVKGWMEGPEGRFTMLEVESAPVPLAIRSDSFGMGPDGRPEKPGDGQLIFVAGMGMGQVTMDKNKALLVRPFVWVQGPGYKGGTTIITPPPNTTPVITPTAAVTVTTGSTTSPMPVHVPSGKPNFFGL